MGYVPTTNYGFQKPEPSNSFTVNDLNNALDAIDAKVKEDITNSVNTGVDGVTLDTLGMSLDEDGNLSISVSDKNGKTVSASQNILSAQGNLVFTGELTDATMTITMVATGKQLYTGAVTSQDIATGSGTIKVNISQYGRTKSYEVQVSGPTPLDITGDIVRITPPSGITSWKINDNNVTGKSAINVIKGSSSITVRLIYGKWKDNSDVTATVKVTPSNNKTINAPDYSDYISIKSSGTFVIPKTANYRVMLISGGGGGGGGGYPILSMEGATYPDIHHARAGNGGQAGSLEYKYSTKSYTENQNISVTIGAGGEGGIGGSSNSESTNGSSGGATIFGDLATASASGGRRGGVGTISSYRAIGGDGGHGGKAHYLSASGGVGAVRNAFSGNYNLISAATNGANGSTYANYGCTMTSGRGGDGGNCLALNNTLAPIRGGRGGNSGVISIKEMITSYSVYAGDGGNGGDIIAFNSSDEYKPQFGEGGSDGRDGVVAISMEL